MDNLFICLGRNDVSGVSEISAIRTNGQLGYLNKKSVLSAFTSLVNGDLSTVLKALENKLNTLDDRFVVITLNAELTRGLIKRDSKNVLFPSRIWVDVSQLTWPLLVNQQIQARTIETLAKHFRVDMVANPDSADDCSTLAQVYGQLMQRYKTALGAEETVREIGGETLEGIRKLVGF